MKQGSLTHPCKVNTFLLLEFEVEAIFQTVASHLHLYTLISCIFAIQGLHKRWFQAYTSLQQGVCLVYFGPILKVKGFVHAKSGGRWSCSTGSHSPQKIFLQNHQCIEFHS